MDLFELGRKHKSVKCYDRFEYSWVYCQDIYPRHFEDRRFDVKNVLEIGVANGGCLLMWKDYFPNANIYGIDKDVQEGLLENIDTDRIFFKQGYQQDGMFLNEVNAQVPYWDIVIDDGSHKWNHIAESYKKIWPYVKPGGIYVIEDVMQKHPQSLYIFNYFYNIISNTFIIQDKNKRHIYGQKRPTDIRNITFYPTLILIEKED